MEVVGSWFNMRRSRQPTRVRYISCVYRIYQFLAYWILHFPAFVGSWICAGSRWWEWTPSSYRADFLRVENNSVCLCVLIVVQQSRIEYGAYRGIYGHIRHLSGLTILYTKSWFYPPKIERLWNCVLKVAGLFIKNSSGNDKFKRQITLSLPARWLRRQIKAFLFKRTRRRWQPRG